VQRVIDDLLEEGADEPLLRAAVQAEFEKKRAAETAWPAETDCDRLDEVFAELNANGIIAIQNAGYTMSDGHSEVGDKLRRRDRNNVKGYCFYHGQDLERAVNGGGLMLAFGDLKNTANGKSAIGMIVKSTIEKHGFVVQWNGESEKRIEVPDIDWKRRTR